MQDLIKDLLTLYKLIVLYMLSCVDFPLTKAQIGDFILEKEYTDFLTLQQTFNELIDAGLITAKSIRNRTHLSITEEGTETLNFFRGKLNEGPGQTDNKRTAYCQVSGSISNIWNILLYMKKSL